MVHVVQFVLESLRAHRTYVISQLLQESSWHVSQMKFHGLNLWTRPDVHKDLIKVYLDKFQGQQPRTFDLVFRNKARVTNAKEELSWLWNVHYAMEQCFADNQLEIFRALLFFIQYKSTLTLYRAFLHEKDSSKMVLLSLIAELANEEGVQDF